MSFWPNCDTGYESKDLHSKRYQRVTASCFTPNIRTPLHSHPDHDQFIYVAHGDVKVITDAQNIHLLAGEARIIPSALPHGFQTGEAGTKILSVYLGEAVTKDTLTDIPEKILRLLDPAKSSSATISTAMLSPKTAAAKEQLSERERETMEWIIERLLTRIESGRTAAAVEKRPSFRRPFLIRAWRKGGTFFMKTPGMALCVMLKNENGFDHIAINEIQGVYSFDAYEKIPRLC